VKGEEVEIVTLIKGDCNITKGNNWGKKKKVPKGIVCLLFLLL
jgi:hypothetical protein